ncbi:hypothetical protein PINS_up011231 [Pythium insidiosum]|nr:hypothetical protein PINS_up011231 [Pythium insidiosum]
MASTGLSSDSDTAWYTPEEKNAFAKELAKTPNKCDVLSSFEICDDDCLQAIETRAKLATDCKAGSLTHREMVLQRLDKCRDFRANATNKYMPEPSPDLRSCDFDELQSFESKYGLGLGPRNCLPQSCSEECPKMFEESIGKAPACAMDGYSLAESNKAKLWRCLMSNKAKLWRCLMSLGRNPLQNEVMMAVVHANGSVTTNTATVSTSAPPTSNFSTARPESSDDSAQSLSPSPLDGGQKAPTSRGSVAESGAVALLMAVVSLTVAW